MTSNLNRNSINDINLNYILITAAKDEEENICNLIESVVTQSIKPIAWFIVDDGSRDKTPQLLIKAAKSYAWIHYIKLNTQGEYDTEEHYSWIYRKGFDYGLDFCCKNNLDYEYIALSDADMMYPSEYFDILLKFLKNNLDYGILSGRILIMGSNNEYYQESKALDDIDQPRGTGRVWRREAFDQTGGYLLTKAPDTVSNILALRRGWKIKQVSQAICYQSRETGGKKSILKGYINRGRRQYYLGRPFLGIINDIIVIALIYNEKRSLIKAISYLYGYISCCILCSEKTQNEEIKKYMGDYRSIFINYLKFLKILKSNILRSKIPNGKN